MKGENMKDESKLTEREKEVMELLCQGYSNPEIARILFVSSHTVKAHVCSIIYKLGAKNRTRAVYLFCERKYTNAA